MGSFANRLSTLAPTSAASNESCSGEDRPKPSNPAIDNECLLAQNPGVWSASLHSRLSVRLQSSRVAPPPVSITATRTPARIALKPVLCCETRPSALTQQSRVRSSWTAKPALPLAQSSGTAFPEIQGEQTNPRAAVIQPRPFVIRHAMRELHTGRGLKMSMPVLRSRKSTVWPDSWVVQQPKKTAASRQPPSGPSKVAIPAA